MGNWKDRYRQYKNDERAKELDRRERRQQTILEEVKQNYRCYICGKHAESAVANDDGNYIGTPADLNPCQTCHKWTCKDHHVGSPAGPTGTTCRVCAEKEMNSVGK